MNISCLEELQMKLDLCLSRDDKLNILKTVGKKISIDKWFVITDDGQCYLFDKDGNLDDISKITAIDTSVIRKNIKRICIPDSVTSIGDFAFYNCTGLTSISIPNSITSIGSSAFAFCIGLTSVMISNSVMNIWEEAFYGCTSLKHITFKGKTQKEVKAMNCYPFGINDTSIIHVE